MHNFFRWRELIQAAGNVSAVEGVMEDYLASLPAEAIAALPADCRRTMQDSDIQTAAVTLLQCELAYGGDPHIAQFLHEVAHTYAAASTRIVRLGRGEGTPTS